MLALTFIMDTARVCNEIFFPFPFLRKSQESLTIQWIGFQPRYTTEYSEELRVTQSHYVLSQCFHMPLGMPITTHSLEGKQVLQANEVTRR